MKLVLLYVSIINGITLFSYEYFFYLKEI